MFLYIICTKKYYAVRKLENLPQSQSRKFIVSEDDLVGVHDLEKDKMDEDPMTFITLLLELLDDDDEPNNLLSSRSEFTLPTMLGMCSCLELKIIWALQDNFGTKISGVSLGYALEPSTCLCDMYHKFLALFSPMVERDGRLFPWTNNCC